MQRIRTHVVGDIPPVISLVRLPRLAYPGMAVTIDAVAIDDRDGKAPREAGRPDVTGRGQAARSSATASAAASCCSSRRSPRATRAARSQHRDDIVGAGATHHRQHRSRAAAMGADLDDVVKLNTLVRGLRHRRGLAARRARAQRGVPLSRSRRHGRAGARAVSRWRRSCARTAGRCAASTASRCRAA